MNRAQRRRTAGKNRSVQVFGRFRSHPIEFGERRNIKRIDIADVFDEFAFDQLIDQFVAEPLDVHRQTRSKMTNRLFALRRDNRARRCSAPLLRRQRGRSPNRTPGNGWE